MDPHYQAIIKAYRAAGRPFFHQVSPVEARAMLNAGMAAMPAPTDLPDLASVVEHEVEGPHGPIPLRCYVPEGEMVGTAVYLHSGGWVIGDLDFADATCRRLAGLSGCEIVSVEYRLAPEHPFPEPLDDAYAALEWAARERPGPLFLFGESAGGNLAAACAIRARDEDGPRLAGQVLVYPVTDHDFASASYREVGGENWLLSTADMRWFWGHYCPAPADRNNPLASPLHVRDASGLPPAFIAVAELDPLREEGLEFARKLEAGGVSVESRCDPGMLHGYFAAAGAIPLAAEALSAATSWMRHRIEETDRGRK